MIRRLATTTWRAARRLDDSLLGDAIGAACLAVTVYIMFFVAGILS